MSDYQKHNIATRLLDVATRLERLKYQLKLIQLVTEHPDRDDFLLTAIFHGVDLALVEVEVLAVQLEVELA